jgi:hypothetical protein
MKSFRKHIDRKGVALFIVLASMATLGIFVSEITYVAAINQKLAYDRLDQVKALALAKSGLRLSLLRIKAYSEIKKTIKKLSGGSEAASAAIPPGLIDKIWSEPITIPFSGDISSLPGSIRDALGKFRKESGMEGKLYLAIRAQSSKFNLNGPVAAFARLPGASGSPTPSPSPGAAEPGGTPAVFSADQARQLLGTQIRDTFQSRMDSDEKFREEYRSLRIEDLIEEILGWADLAYESNREQASPYPFKKAPFYNISELHHLPSMDDRLYDLLSSQFHAGVSSKLNLNTIQEDVLKALVPGITKEEIKRFFDLRDGTSSPDGKGQAAEGQPFKSAEDFYRFLKEKVQAFSGSETRIQDLKTSLAQRGIELVTDETDFLVHVEATVNQTKKTLEAMVSLVEEAPRTPNPNTPNAPIAPDRGRSGTPVTPAERSNFKVTQLRFL